MTGLLLGSFMGSMETTVIATAMPTIVRELGGLGIYSWAFSIYVLASSAGIPVAGKLSDLFGRRWIYGFSMALFLLGSLACAFAPNMPVLIVMRGLQGLGAAGLLPLALAMVGDLYTFAERAKIQALFAMVWGVSSVAGPLIGGLLVAQLGWPSVFYVNVPFGVFSAWLVWKYGRDRERNEAGKPHVDYAGAILITAAAIAILLGFLDVASLWGVALVSLALGLTWWLVRVERRSPDPILPLELFTWPLFRVAVLQSTAVGWLLNGVTAFVPLYVQEVRKGSAMEAGAALTPMLLGWVAASTLSARLMLRTGYRGPAVGGTALVVVGAALLLVVGPEVPVWWLTGSMVLMGTGFGFSVPTLLIAVQMLVEKRHMGVATSALQFSRSLGGAVGVGAMGAVLNWRSAAGNMDAGIQATFWVGAAASLAALAVVLRAPQVSAEEMGRSR